MKEVTVLVSGRYLDSLNLDSEIPRQYLDSQKWIRARVFVRVRVSVSFKVSVWVSYDCPGFDCPD